MKKEELIKETLEKLGKIDTHYLWVITTSGKSIMEEIINEALFQARQEERERIKEIIKKELDFLEKSRQS